MKVTILVPLAFLLACGPLSAQESAWSMGTKFGIGGVLSGTAPQNVRESVNGGLWVERKLGGPSSVFAEFSYHYFRAMDHEVTRLGTGYYPAIGSNPAGTGYITVYKSADTRKDTLEGYGLNLGYRHALTQDLSVHGGLSVNIWNSQQEVQGQVMVVNGTGSTAANIWKEGFSYVPGEHSTRLGAFAGIRYGLTENAFLEVNGRYQSYKWLNYVPYAYTGQPAHNETETKSKVTVEFDLGIRF